MAEIFPPGGVPGMSEEKAVGFNIQTPQKYSLDLMAIQPIVVETLH